MTEDIMEIDNVNDTLQNSEESADTQEKTETSDNAPSADAQIDYGELVKEDMRELMGEFPELSQLSDISELENPLRYAALRDLGLTPAEAYLATTKRRKSFDNRSHLRSSPMVAAKSGSFIPEQEMEIARELFSDMSDSEIRQLYKKVTKGK